MKGKCSVKLSVVYLYPLLKLLLGNIEALSIEKDKLFVYLQEYIQGKRIQTLYLMVCSSTYLHKKGSTICCPITYLY